MTDTPSCPDTDFPATTPKRPTYSKSIVLVGMMGAGKTTIGKRLAHKLQMDFVDSDDEIEKAANMRIVDYFQKYGVDAFRDGEERVIARILQQSPRVVATGGGAFISATTRRLVKENAISIWLQADLSTLVKRTALRGTRPLLHGVGPEKALTDLLNTRAPFYAEADMCIQSGNASSHHAVVNDILSALNTGLTCK